MDGATLVSAAVSLHNCTLQTDWGLQIPCIVSLLQHAAQHKEVRDDRISAQWLQESRQICFIFAIHTCLVIDYDECE